MFYFSFNLACAIQLYLQYICNCNMFIINRRVGVWSLPWHWHILSILIDNRSRNRRRNLWVGWCVSSWWTLFPSRSSVIYLYIYIYIYIYTYIYIMHFLYKFCFLSFTNWVLLSGDNSLIPGCLWLLAFLLNDNLILSIWLLDLTCPTIYSYQDISTILFPFVEM